MLVISFEGWFQSRFAQDPDPPNSPRGISGPTVAVAGEPDFDGVIRLQDAVCPRWPRLDDVPQNQLEDIGGGVGVNVSQVAYRNPSAPPGTPDEVRKNHPLMGAQTRFLPWPPDEGLSGSAKPGQLSGSPKPRQPKFHQRNYIIVEGLRSPIDPLNFEISKVSEDNERIVLRRRFLWNLTSPSSTIYDVCTDPALYGNQKQTMEIQSVRAAHATGIGDYARYRQQRMTHLKERLEASKNKEAEEEKKKKNRIGELALEKRIEGIERDADMTGPRLAAQQFLGMLSTYSMDLNGEPTVQDPDGALGGECGISQAWPLEFWMGAYDVDTLCGYMRGTLVVPFCSQD